MKLVEASHNNKISYYEAPCQYSLASESTISVISDYDRTEAMLFTHHTTEGVSAIDTEQETPSNDQSQPESARVRKCQPNSKSFGTSKAGI